MLVAMSLIRENRQKIPAKFLELSARQLDVLINNEDEKKKTSLDPDAYIRSCYYLESFFIYCFIFNCIYYLLKNEKVVINKIHVEKN